MLFVSELSGVMTESVRFRRKRYERISSVRGRTGNENTGSDHEGLKWAIIMDGGGGDSGGQLPNDAPMEAVLLAHGLWRPHSKGWKTRENHPSYMNHNGQTTHHRHRIT